MNRQMRKLFLSTIVGGALGLIAAGSPARAAVTGEIQTLQPTTGWAISRIASNEAGGAPYCAMARKFSDDMILTFARNSKNEISVAVDFQHDMLSTGQNYFTVLKPGYSQDRAFNVKPVSSKALVIRMGADSDFFEALGRSERLTVDLNGDQYSFVMPEMGGGLHDMRDCLSSVSARGGMRADASQAAQMADMKPAAGAAAGDQNGSDLNASDMVPMPGEQPAAPRVAAQADDMPPPAAMPVERVTRQKMADAPSFAKTGPSQAELDSARDENARLKNELAEARRNFAQQTASAASAQSGDTAKAAELSSRVAELQRQNTDLNNQLSQTSSQMQAAKTQLALLQSQSASKSSAQSDADTAKVSQLTAQISQLQQLNDSLRNQLSQTATAAQAARIEMQTKLSSQNIGSVQAVQLNDRIADLEKQNDGLRVQLSQSAASAQTARADAAKAQADAAQKMASAAPAACSAPGKQASADPGLQAQLATLREENRSLHEKAAAAPGPSEELATLQTENKHLNDEVESLHKQLTSVASIPPAAAGDDQATVARLTSRIDQLESENASLTDSITKVQIDPGAGVDGTVKLSQLRATEALLDAAKADRDRLQRKLDDIRTGKEDQLLASAGDNWDLKKATQRYTESQREVDRLGRQIQTEREACTKDKKEAEYTLFDPRIASKAQMAKLAEVEKNLKLARAQLDKRDNETAGIRKEYETKIAALKSQLTAKQTQLASAQSALDNAKADYQGKLASAQSGTAELAQLKKQLSDKETQLAQAIAQTQGAKADYEHQLAAAKQDIVARDQQLADARIKLTGLQKDFDGKMAAAQTDSSQVAVLQASTANLNSQLAAKSQQLAEARTQIDTMQKDYEQKLASAQASTSQLSQVQTASADLSRQLAEKNQQLAAAQTNLTALQTQLSDERSHASAVQAQLQQVQTAQAGQVAKADQAASADLNALRQEKQKSDERVASLEKANQQLQAALASAAPAAGNSTASANADVASAAPVAAHAVAKGAVSTVQASADMMASAAPTPIVADAAVASAAAVPSQAGRIVRENVDAMPVASVPPVVAEPVPAPVVASARPAVETPAVPGIELASGTAKFSSPSSMENMLSSAGIKVSRDVRKVEKASGPDRLAMSWQIGKLYGSAEQRPMAGPGAFDGYVQQYLDKTKKRCAGQFAAVPGQAQTVSGVQTANYEIACVTDSGAGASASLLFYSHDGMFTSIAHESSVESMDQAMDVRDRLASSVTSSRVASR